MHCGNLAELPEVKLTGVPGATPGPPESLALRRVHTERQQLANHSAGSPPGAGFRGAFCSVRCDSPRPSFKNHLRERQSGRERGESTLPSAGPLPKCPQQPGPGPVEDRRRELHLDLPRGWQAPRYLGRPLLLPGRVSRALDRKQSRWDSLALGQQEMCALHPLSLEFWEQP